MRQAKAEPQDLKIGVHGDRHPEHRWGVVLAGGDGVRLQGLTRLIFGDNRPKQFCPLLSQRTLLHEARRRAERSIRPERVLYSLTRDHREYYLRDLKDTHSRRVIQPSNKGTAPAILSALVDIAKLDADAVVAILPSDHYYSREDSFTAALESAFATAEADPASVLLLGADPKAPEVEYGWIELSRKAGPLPGVFRVTTFHEKPPLCVAEELLTSGCLWNTFVMIGHVNAYLDLALASVPHLLNALRSPHASSSFGYETEIAGGLYERIASTDFSRDVLSPGAGRLLSVTLGNVEWNDLGDPDRVISVLLDRGGELPDWALRWRAERNVGQLTSTAGG